MRKMLTVFLVCIITLAFFGCAKTLNTEEKVVDVKVLATAIVGQEKHNVYVQYEGFELTINNADAYNFCKEKENEIVKATVKTIKYDSGIETYELLAINQ